MQLVFGTQLCSNLLPGAFCRIPEVQAAAWRWLTKPVRSQLNACWPVRTSPALAHADLQFSPMCTLKFSIEPDDKIPNAQLAISPTQHPTRVRSTPSTINIHRPMASHPFYNPFNRPPFFPFGGLY